MKLTGYSKSLLAVPVALLAATAMPDKAQAQCHNSYGYSVPNYYYAPTPEVYYHTSNSYYAPPPVVYAPPPVVYAPAPVYYEAPRRSFSFGFSIGRSHHHGHHGHHRSGFGFHIGHH